LKSEWEANCSVNIILFRVFILLTDIYSKSFGK